MEMQSKRKKINNTKKNEKKVKKECCFSKIAF